MERKHRDTLLARLESVQLSRRQLVRAAAGAAGVALTAPLFAAAQTVGGESKVIMGYSASVYDLDPHKNSFTVQESVLRNMYECLVAFSPDLKTLEPQLATEWKRIDDLTMQFKLRQGVKFHNGEDFDAEAVSYSIKRMLDPETKAPFLSVYGSIVRANVVDKYTVNVITKKPDPTLLQRMSGFHTIIVPPRYFSTAKAEDLATKPIGTGPYKLVSWTKDADMVLEANASYWGPKPKIQKVIIRGIPEAGTRVAALLAGDVDIINAAPPDDIDRINRSGKARAINIPGNRVVHYRINVSTKPLDNKLVRQAMNYAVDWDSIIKYVLSGRGYRRATLLNPWYECYDPEVKPFPYDPEKAKDLLKRAGVPDGFQVNFHVVQGRVPKDKEVGEAMAGMLAKVGIRCNVRIIDVGTYVSQGASGKLDGFMFGSHGNWMHEPDNSLHNNYFSASQASRMYRGGWKNEEYDRIVEQARYELDKAKRTQFFTQAQKILLDECPDIFAYAIEDIYGVNNKIKWTPRTDEMVWYKEMSPA